MTGNRIASAATLLGALAVGIVTILIAIHHGPMLTVMDDASQGGNTFVILFGSVFVPLGKVAAWMCLIGAFSILVRQILLSPKVPNWPDGANWLRVVMFATGSALAYFGVALQRSDLGARCHSTSMVSVIGIHTVLQVASLVWVFAQRRKVFVELLEREGWWVFSTARMVKTRIGGATIGADVPHPENLI